MDLVRKTLGGLLALLGAYYCIVSLVTLTRLPSVTTRWIERSNDPDFRYDYGTFLWWIGAGAVLVGVFGYLSIVKGIRTARGSHESWLGLAIGAPVLHWFWLMYRFIDNGVLGREAALAAMRSSGIVFGAICAAYIVMAMLMWSRDSARPRRFIRWAL
jgi:hypothetical protein